RQQRSLRVGRYPCALLRVEVLYGLEQALVAFLDQVLEADAAPHELAGDRDDEAQVVHHELFLGTPIALPRLPRHHELRLAVERRMRADQLDQRRQIVEFTAVARHLSFLSSPSKRSKSPVHLTAQPSSCSRLPLMHNARRCCAFHFASL